MPEIGFLCIEDTAKNSTSKCDDKSQHVDQEILPEAQITNSNGENYNNSCSINNSSKSPSLKEPIVSQVNI